MNQNQINELMSIAQENSWVAGTFLNFEIFVLKHFLLLTIFFVCYGLFWLFLINDDLKHETGIDRLMWLVLLLALPFFGSLFYLRRLLEREANDLPPSSRPGWKSSIG